MNTKWIVIALLSLVLIGCGQLLPASDPLAGTGWVFTNYDDKELQNNDLITLRFEGYQLSGYSGCNFYEGEYDVRGESINVTALTHTIVACLAEGIMEQEEEYLNNLHDVVSFELEDNQLTLITSENRKLVFVPVGD